VKSVVGTILSLLILLLVAFGLISFATEFFLGKPLLQVIEDFLFMFYRK
jgi:hypothetical protein